MTDPANILSGVDAVLAARRRGDTVSTSRYVELIHATYPEALAVIRAALDIAEGKFIDTDGETLDEWCHWCESMTLATHLDWCPWPALRSSVAAFLAKAQEYVPDA